MPEISIIFTVKIPSFGGIVFLHILMQKLEKIAFDEAANFY